MMKRLWFVGYGIVLALLIATVIPGKSVADESAPYPIKLSGGTLIDTDSRYVWRGMANSRGGVVQPSLWVTRANLTLTFWGNAAVARADGRQWNESDWTLTDTGSWGRVAVEGDYTTYTYPHQAGTPSTAEAALKLSIPWKSGRLFTTQNFDVARYPGSYYAEIGVSGSHALPRLGLGDTTITLGIGSARFNEVYLGRRKSALNVATWDMGIARPLGGITLRPHLTMSALIDPALRRAASKPDTITLGISVERDW